MQEARPQRKSYGFDAGSQPITIRDPEHMISSLIMSRIQKTTPTTFLPQLPIEVWFARIAYCTWALGEDEDDPMLEVLDRKKLVKRVFRGREYLDALLAINAPEQLVKFMNTYACPFPQGDPINVKYEGTTVGFRWSTFVTARENVKQAMRLPIPTLLRNPKFKTFFELQHTGVSIERRGGVYYGEQVMSPSFESCYKVIALERVLANVEFSFCERCHHPFQVTSKHKRKYCSKECAHAVAQEEYRERKKRERPWEQ
jgi:hypothetical protein